ncbi:ACR domain containing protein [Nitzschia inconspicua]|uniref:ACR domain containing protein n=1 Tax=Nitzschia inconspicua TaxID=303405 RepID=A0A9K3KCD1_9STRA|nr:ACR domain containing protein [Nitzschia inconspicua]
MDELQNHQRDYELTIQATSDECMALCRRFELTQVNDLSASLKIRPAMGAIDNLVLPVEVEGSITASVTQTCVRSNEQFQVEVEFPIYCLVKPMSMEALWSSSSSTITSNNLMEDNDDYSTSKSKKKTNKRNNRRKNKAVHSLEDVWELQSAIQSNIRDANSGDDDTDDLNDPLALHASATLVEDESIYSSTSGRLDVGELVAQTFWLQLDPFPKKPGTGPMQMEITG